MDRAFEASSPKNSKGRLCPAFLLPGSEARTLWISMIGYRVARRTDIDPHRSWGLWSDDQNRWFDVIFPTEREAANTLSYLLAAADTATEK